MFEYLSQTHPNVDKKLFSSDNIIALKNSAKGFPVSQPLGVLRWRYFTKDETVIPLSSIINFNLLCQSTFVL